MVAFILHSIGTYNGEKTAYNGGTGVIPSFRKRQLVYKLYDLLLPNLQMHGVARCVLEVLNKNESAIKVYDKIGFKKARTLYSFKLKKGLLKKPTEPQFFQLIPTSEVNEIKNACDLSCNDFNPSFMGVQLLERPRDFGVTCVMAHLDARCVGYILFQPQTGRINHIIVDKAYRNKGIGKNLLYFAYNRCKNRHLIIYNIDSKAEAAIFFLRKLGFESHLVQYEMDLVLTGK